jgi:hypothetical protein
LLLLLLVERLQYWYITWIAILGLDGQDEGTQPCKYSTALFSLLAAPQIHASQRQPRCRSTETRASIQVMLPSQYRHWAAQGARSLKAAKLAKSTHESRAATSAVSSDSVNW